MDRSKWEYKMFEDCIEKSKKTKQLMTSDYQSEGLYPIISQEANLISGYTNDSDFVNHFSSSVVIFGDHTRVLKYVDFDFAVGADGVKILIPKDGLDAKFLLDYLLWYKVPNLGYSRHYKLLKDISVPVPPIEDQQRIVAELDCLNKMIAVKQEQLKEFDKLAQSVFYDMFGKLDAPQHTLKDVLSKMGSGATPSGGNQSYKTEGTSLIRSLNVHNNEFIYTDLAFIDDEQARKLDNVIIEENDVLLNITGASVARCCIVPSDVLPARVNQHVTILRTKSNLINSTYLCHLLISKEEQTKLIALSKSKAATREALPKNILEKYLIPLPPLELQQQFADKISAIEAQKELVKQSIAETQYLFNSRMDYYFN